MRPRPYASWVYQCNRKTVLEAAGWRCCRCGGPANTVDHIRPLAFGGTHDVANLRAMCRRCNSQLGCQTLQQVNSRRRLGRLSRKW
jgi:5-methylcytosine-specific restriction endonuclease McrA